MARRFSISQTAHPERSSGAPGRGRALGLALAICLLILALPVLAQQSTAAHKKTSSAKKASTKPTAKRSSTTKKKTTSRASSKKTLTPAQRAAAIKRAQRLKKAFVASTELRPMAQQLLANRTPAAYTGVEAWARKHAGSDAAGLAWLVDGYGHYMDREFDRAIVVLQKAQPDAGELADYVAYYLAQSLAATGQGEKALTPLAGFATTWQESLYARDAALLRANLLTTLGRPQEALAVLAPYRATFRADFEVAVGRAYAKSGDALKAAETLRRVYYTAPTSSAAEDAARELAVLENDPRVPPPSFADRRQRAELLLNGRRYADAAKEYRLLLAGTQPANLAELQVQLAIATYRSGNRSDARRALEPITDLPAELAAKRLYFLGELARFDNDEDRFRRVLDEFRQQYPQNAWLEESLLSLGNMYLLRRDYENAIKAYREMNERFPSGKHASYGHWKVAWLTLRQGRSAEARQLFEEHVRRYPQSAEVPPAIYWRARLAEEENEGGRARTWYARLAQRFRNYYYADLARERLRALRAEGITDDAVLDAVSKPAPPHFVDSAPPAEDVRLQKSRLLRNGALFEFAVRELEAASSNGAADWATGEMLRVYEEAARYDRALQLMKRTVPSYFTLDVPALPRTYWEALFPRPFWDELRRDAAANGLDPYLVASLIRQESEFNPLAISHANAWGLMQLLPNVGKELARDVKLRGFATDQLLRPEVNLRLGTRHFKAMLDKYDGRVEYALAAYNAGADRVDDWRASGNYRDMAEFVESIPFTETREYVQAIVRNASMYRRLYGSTEAAAATADQK
jgi:soluble lytic murein transglycosylase